MCFVGRAAVVVAVGDSAVFGFARAFLFFVVFRVFAQVHHDEGRQQDDVGDPFRRLAGERHLTGTA